MSSFLEMQLDEMIRICESIGIDTTQYAELIEEMHWDGFRASEIKEQIEVLQDKHKYAHLRSI